MQSKFARQRSQFRLARALRRGILLAVTAGLAAVPAAGAVTYPVDGGNGFARDTEDWQATAAACSPNLLCTEQNLWNGTQGNPPGSLESRLDIFVNAGSLYQGTATWQSPVFTATASGAGTLRFDRQLEAGGLTSLNPASSVEPVLVDVTDNSTQSLGTAPLSEANSTFQTRTIAVPEGTFTPGDRYRLQLRSTTATSSVQAGLTGSISLRLDNVSVKIANTGPGGSAGSDGVQFTGPPLTQKQINKLIKKINWAAQIGNLPGGSIVPREDCTIVGTPHKDTIKGSGGNDVICGMGGNDTITGRGGTDVIDGGAGSDRIAGSRGSDVIAGLAGKDRIAGGAGNDRAGGGAGNERLGGARGRDNLKAGRGNDRLSGGPGKDRLSGGAGKDRVLKVCHDRLRSIERRGHR